MPLACSPWLSSKKILHMSLFVCFQILSDFNADESCWSDSPGKLLVSHLRTSRGCASCPVLLKTRSSAASCSIHPMNNHSSAPAAWDKAGVGECQISKQRKHTELRDKAAKRSQGLGTERHLKLIFRVFCLGSEGSAMCSHLLAKEKLGITFYIQKTHAWVHL